MNIVIVNCFDTWEHRVDLLYKILIEEGHKVCLLLSDYRHIEKVRRTDKKKASYFFYAESYTRNMSLARLKSHYNLSKKIFGFVKKHIDCIDLLWVLAPPNSFVADAGRVKKRYPEVRLIIDLIDLWPETMPVGRLKKLPIFALWKRIRDKNLLYADCIVTECNLYKEVLGRNAKDRGVKTLYLAREDKGYESELNLPEEKISLCYLGSINNIIDIDTIGEIIKDFKRDKPVILHVIGDGERKSELLKAAKDTGAEVVDHGKVYNRNAKQKIFDSCHYGLNIMKSSVCVGLTMKSIDYFEFGLPIINNIKGDTWNAVTKYDCGVNVSEDVTNFVRERGLLNTEIHNSQRKNSRKFFESFLTEKCFYDNLTRIMSEMKAD